MAGTAFFSTPFFKTSLISSPSHRNPCNPSPPFVLNIEKRLLYRCSAKKKISFVDQILDYIEGTVQSIGKFENFECGLCKKWKLFVSMLYVMCVFVLGL